MGTGGKRQTERGIAQGIQKQKSKVSQMGGLRSDIHPGSPK